MTNEKESSLEEACRSADYIFNLREVVQTHPCESARNFGMSVLSLFAEENENSLKQLESLAKKNPNIVLLHQQIAEFCIDSKKYEKATVHLEKVIELEKQNLTAQVWLCLIYYSLGKTEKAKKKFEYLKELVYKIRVKTRKWRDE